MTSHHRSLVKFLFLLVLIPGCARQRSASAERKVETGPIPSSASRAAAEAPPADFGPAEDGKEKSHADLEKRGWIYIFDSRVPSGEKWDPLGLFRVRNAGDPKRNLWSVAEEGGERVLRNTIPQGGHGTDLISKQSFWDFDIHAELRVPENSNSGVYLRGRYEIQVLSTPAGKDRALAPHDLGGIYNIKAPSVNASRGPGDWQTLDASIRGLVVTAVRLNGETIHEDVEIPEKWRKGTGSELGSGDGVSPDVSSPGPIFLQGDHGSVDFRNIRIRPVATDRSAGLTG